MDRSRPSTACVARRVLLAVVPFGFALVTNSCGFGSEQGLEIRPADGSRVDHRFVIPLGSGAAIDRGETLDLLPASLELSVGQVVEIVNEDDRGHLVGPFFVGAHETVRHQFSSPGSFEGICSVHPSGQLVIVVS